MLVRVESFRYQHHTTQSEKTRYFGSSCLLLVSYSFIMAQWRCSCIKNGLQSQHITVLERICNQFWTGWYKSLVGIKARFFLKIEIKKKFPLCPLLSKASCFYAASSFSYIRVKTTAIPVQLFTRRRLVS